MAKKSKDKQWIFLPKFREKVFVDLGNSSIKPIAIDK